MLKERRSRPNDKQTQHEKFVALARASGADESESAFVGKLKKIVPPKSEPVELPDTGCVEMEMLMVLKMGRSATAQECYCALAERLKLTPAQLRAKIHNTKSEYAWHNRVRTARNHLVKRGLMCALPRNSWKLTQKGIERAAKLEMLRAEGLAGL